MSFVDRMACAVHGHTFCDEFHHDQETCLVCGDITWGDDVWAGKLAIEAGVKRPVLLVTKDDRCPICAGAATTDKAQS